MLFLLIVSAWSVVPALRDPQVGPVFMSILGEHLTQLRDFRGECQPQSVDGARFVVQKITLSIDSSSHILNSIRQTRKERVSSTLNEPEAKPSIDRKSTRLNSS